MTSTLMALTGLGIALAVLAPMRVVRVRRYSRSHVAAEFAIAGRGLYFSRTPDGTWCRLRLRPCRGAREDRGWWGEPPPDSGVREPRRPPSLDPLAGAIELDPP